MTNRDYKVFINDTVVAERMDIEIATTLIKALFEKNYNDHSMIISIREEDRVEQSRGE